MEVALGGDCLADAGILGAKPPLFGQSPPTPVIRTISVSVSSAPEGDTIPWPSSDTAIFARGQGMARVYITDPVSVRAAGIVGPRLSARECHVPQEYVLAVSRHQAASRNMLVPITHQYLCSAPPKPQALQPRHRCRPAFLKTSWYRLAMPSQAASAVNRFRKRL